jgi:CRISPR-associated protein Cas5t
MMTMGQAEAGGSSRSAANARPRPLPPSPETVAIYVNVPVASFRNPHAREYLETFPCPPPATVYGMLLSAVGEASRRAHAGAEVALALLSEPALSAVLRTKWRVKFAGRPLGSGANKVPDYQELLTGVRMLVWARKGAGEQASPSLGERLDRLLLDPSATRRFGALSLGESTHMVDDFRRWRAEDGAEGRLLVRAEDGDLSLPVWADHVSSASTRWGRYRLEAREWETGLPPEEAWTTIAPD